MSSDQPRTLFFIYHGRYPSEKAASLFAAKAAEAFGDEGENVVLLVPRLSRVADDSFKYFNIRPTFGVVYLPTIDLFRTPLWPGMSFYISYLCFTFSCFIYLVAKARRSDVVYSNGILPLLAAKLRCQGVFYELHDFPERKLWFHRWSMVRMRGIVIHNKWKLERVGTLGLPAARLFYQPNAVDLDEFDSPLTKEEARKRLGLGTDLRMVVYTGHLYSWKGVDTLAQAAGLLSDDIRIFCVGGTPSDIRNFRQTYAGVPSLSIVGHRNHAEVPIWQKAADVLVLPNTGRDNISKYYTSPMKLFEYMASGRPIVATDLPSIMEILDNDAAFICKPDDPSAMAAAIKRAFDDPLHAARLAQRSHHKSRNFTWRARASRILTFIDTLQNSECCGGTSGG